MVQGLQVRGPLPISFLRLRKEVSPLLPYVVCSSSYFFFMLFCRCFFTCLDMLHCSMLYYDIFIALVLLLFYLGSFYVQLDFFLSFSYFFIYIFYGFSQFLIFFVKFIFVELEEKVFLIFRSFSPHLVAIHLNFTLRERERVNCTLYLQSFLINILYLFLNSFN